MLCVCPRALSPPTKSCRRSHQRRRHADTSASVGRTLELAFARPLCGSVNKSQREMTSLRNGSALGGRFLSPSLAVRRSLHLIHRNCYKKPIASHGCAHGAQPNGSTRRPRSCSPPTAIRRTPSMLRSAFYAASSHGCPSLLHRPAWPTTSSILSSSRMTGFGCAVS